MSKEFTKITSKNYLKFVMPTIFSMVFISIYTMTDGIFVANKLGSTALAALNVTIPAKSFISGLLFMVVIGSFAIIGINMGANDYKKANKNFTNMIYALIGISIFDLIVGLYFTDDIARLLGATETMMAYAVDYLYIQFVCGFCFVSKIFAEIFLRMEGKFKMFLAGTITGGIANIVFDYIFMYPLGMGIKGAALGSLMGALINGLFGVVYFLSRKSKLKLVKAKVDFKFLKDSILNGSSEMITSISTGITTLVFNLILIKLAGDIGVASISIILYLNFLLSSIFIGVSMGIQPIISYNFGAKLFDNIKKLLRLSLKVILVIGVIAFLGCNIFKYPLVYLFERENVELINLTAGALTFFSFNFLISGINILASSAFTALNNGRYSAIIAFARSLGFNVGLVLILSHLFGLNGVWLTNPLAEILCLFITLYFYKKSKKIFAS